MSTYNLLLDFSVSAYVHSKEATVMRIGIRGAKLAYGLLAVFVSTINTYSPLHPYSPVPTAAVGHWTSTNKVVGCG